MTTSLASSWHRGASTVGVCKVHLINRREGVSQEVCSFRDYPLLGPALWSFLSLDWYGSLLETRESTEGDVSRLHPLVAEVSVDRSLRLALAWTSMRTWCPFDEYNRLGEICRNVSARMRDCTSRGAANLTRAAVEWDALADHMHFCGFHVTRGELAQHGMGLVFQWNDDRCVRWWESRGDGPTPVRLDLRLLEDLVRVRTPKSGDQGVVHEGLRDLDLGVPRSGPAPRPPRTAAGRDRPRRR